MEDAILFRELYTLREAAHILQIAAPKLRYWLDGAWRKGVFYAPVIRPEPTGSDIVTWGEFVEAACLREYRGHVSLQRLRPAVAKLRSQFNLLYPLANLRPFIAAGDLVMEVQQQVGLPRSLRFVERVSDGQLSFTPTFDLFRVNVDFADSGDQPALRLYPDGRDSQVVVDPNRSFGAATVRGIRTDVLAELVVAGETREDVMGWFGLEEEALMDALAYERVAEVVDLR